mgnify:CR=1 FL=1
MNANNAKVQAVIESTFNSAIKKMRNTDKRRAGESCFRAQKNE